MSKSLRLWSVEAKFERLEWRITILESESMSKDIEINALAGRLEQQCRINHEMQEQIEGMDINGRMASLNSDLRRFRAAASGRGHRAAGRSSHQPAVPAAQHDRG